MLCFVGVLQLGEFKEAVDCYTAAIELEPSNSYAHYNRGITKDKLSDFAGAIEYHCLSVPAEGMCASILVIPHAVALKLHGSHAAAWY
eukprot:1160622-Pelagomonas_calceolata.AAC.11